MRRRGGVRSGAGLVLPGPARTGGPAEEGDAALRGVRQRGGAPGLAPAGGPFRLPLVAGGEDDERVGGGPRARLVVLVAHARRDECGEEPAAGRGLGAVHEEDPRVVVPGGPARVLLRQLAGARGAQRRVPLRLVLGVGEERGQQRADRGRPGRGTQSDQRVEGARGLGLRDAYVPAQCVAQAPAGGALQQRSDHRPGPFPYGGDDFARLPLDERAERAGDHDVHRGVHGLLQPGGEPAAAGVAGVLLDQALDLVRGPGAVLLEVLVEGQQPEGEPVEDGAAPQRVPAAHHLEGHQGRGRHRVQRVLVEVEVGVDHRGAAALGQGAEHGGLARLPGPEQRHHGLPLVRIPPDHVPKKSVGPLRMAQLRRCAHHSPAPQPKARRTRRRNGR